jgi:hypothetical protein
MVQPAKWRLIRGAAIGLKAVFPRKLGSDVVSVSTIFALPVLGDRAVEETGFLANAASKLSSLENFPSPLTVLFFLAIVLFLLCLS